ncbi:N-acetylglucosamine-6-phosphate deacetylase [Microterricola viridarii]|uniref:N-acetylglucosamine-6-phosphate deacetylase n=1 Tax=Microterricola viridarii TaxID=412690 RepID=UPI001F26EC89|nr:N-acetylglucosamine-6-phosphate deacetylase [Microterricola viridarii]
MSTNAVNPNPLSPATIVIHSARLVTGGQITADAWVAFSGERVLTVGSGDGWRELASAETAVTDAGGRWLTPGFVDIHCHGAGGAAFDDGIDGIRAALAVHRAHGTTRSVISFVTNTGPALLGSLRTVAELASIDPLVLGSHLEGPFLDTTYKGAHNEALLRSAAPAELDAMLDAASGTLRQITLAPELPGAQEAIARLVDAGVAVAVGHTAADYDQALAAFNAGASILTHAFNGMRGIHHRAPGPVAAAMHAGGVTLEVINDGTHVHPEVVRMAFNAAPGRIALITDAMAATGSADGDYLLGALAVTVTDGVARLVDGGSIAGSTLTLDDAVRRAVTEVGIGIETAIEAVTAVPARAIGRGDDLGTLAAGFAADALILNDDFTVAAVWANGAQLV